MIPSSGIPLVTPNTSIGAATAVTCFCVNNKTTTCDKTNQSSSTTNNNNNDSTGINNDQSILCSVCVRNSLQEVHARHEAVKKEWNIARKECEFYYTKNHNNNSSSPIHIAELQNQSQILRNELDKLRRECAQEAVYTCQKQLYNEERHVYQQKQLQVTMQREKLHELEKHICNTNTGALTHAINTAQNQVRTLRYAWALQAFQMHRLQVDITELKQREEDKTKLLRKNDNQRKHVSGIGKIGGLPLPHAGPELYGVLPVEELQSALRLVASLTNSIAQCLGILLPHPILLHPQSTGNTTHNKDDIASPNTENSITTTKQNIPISGQREPVSLAISISTALQVSSFFGQQDSNKQNFATNTASTTSQQPLSMDVQHVQQRLRHAISTVIAEDRNTKSTTYYTLSADKVNQDDFAIALQLLQNNIIALSIRAGVPVDDLWPGEAVLLNLHALCLYCELQVQ